ncbi:hypothetical protein GCM10018952_18340 [Streptosporangium vulgare]
MQLVAEDEHPETAPRDQAEDGEHEGVGGDREGRARLPDPAQVDDRQQHDDDDRDQRLVLGDVRDGGAHVVDAVGDRDRDGQHVVDHQGAGDGQTRVRAEVDGGDLVVAAPAGVGVHVLPVRRHDGEHHHDDGDGDPGAEVVEGDPREGEDDEDLLRGVGHGREGVTREDGQRDALGEQLLVQLRAAQRPPDEKAFDKVRHLRHVSRC